MFDYTKQKNETAAKKQARIDLTNLFMEYLVKEFGEENVRMVDKNTIGFIFGNVNDNDGCPCDMVATVKPVIKNYQDHIGELKTTYAYDLFEDAKAFEMGKKKSKED